MALTKIKTGSVSDSITLTTPDINGGTIDGTVIGGATPAVATFTDVGIGTSSPSAKLDVLNGGNTYTSGLLLRNGTSTSEATSLYHDNTGSTTTVLANRYGSAASAIKLVLQAASASPVTALTALGNGNVGINTVSPDAVFTVDSNVGGSSTGTIARFHSSKGESDSTFLQIAATRHGTASVQRVQLQAFDDDGSTPRSLCLNNAGGDVLVGTASNASGQRLHIESAAQFGQIGLRHSSATAGQFWYVGPASNNTFAIYNQSPAGVYLANGATSWTGASDENSKENIVELTGALDKVKDFRCVEYNLIADETNSKKIGFIAQDWQEDYSQVVSQDPDGNLGIQYTETIPVLLKAIQEQQTLIDALAARITALEGA